jgi:hypothetical protein
MSDIIDQRLEVLKLAASLNAPNSHVPDVMRTADKLWEWTTQGQPPVSKTKANILKSVERLGASQTSEKDTT